MRLIATRMPGLMLAASLGLAACGGAAAPSASGPAASAAKPAVSSAAPAAASATSAKPAASASASAATKPAASSAGGGPIKIGFIEPLTGPQAQPGKDNNDGFSLFLDSVNGTMAGRKIQPVFADDQLSADTGLTKAKGLVEGEKVAALMGFTFTPVVYAVAAYVKNQAHLPMLVSANATGEGLFLDPKLTSEYLTRFTENSAAYSATAADWAYKNGYRKAIILTYDTAAGIENGDFWARAFIARGGSVVQEFHPPANTSDYGTYLAQMDKSADIVLEFAPGADGLRMLQQYANYGGEKKPLFFDLGAVATGGPNVDELKDKAVGVVANKSWVESLDNPENQAFLKALHAKYPSRTPSNDLAMGWASGQILQAALQKVNGNIEDVPNFLKAVNATDIKVPKGEVKLDDTRDIVQDYYVYKIVKQGDKYTQQVLDTYKSASQYYDIPADQMKRFPFGQLKGKWVGMTKDKLPTLLK